MNDIVKKAMLEFIEPGSSITLETLLDEFGKMANETKRGSFSITKNVRTGKWRVNITGLRKSFIDHSLRKCIINAGDFIFKNRIKTETEFILKP